MILNTEMNIESKKNILRKINKEKGKELFEIEGDYLIVYRKSMNKNEKLPKIDLKKGCGLWQFLGQGTYVYSYLSGNESDLHWSYRYQNIIPDRYKIHLKYVFGPFGDMVGDEWDDTDEWDEWENKIENNKIDDYKILRDENKEINVHIGVGFFRLMQIRILLEFGDKVCWIDQPDNIICYSNQLIKK